MRLQKRWLAGFAVTVALGSWSSGPALAQSRYWNSGQTLTVEPKMNLIPNTDVYYQRRAPGYDFYRYANRWYVVDAGSWFSSASWRGPFASIELADLPDELTAIPGTYRKYWDPDAKPSWASRKTFTKKPRMMAITPRGVTYAHQLTEIDLYRYRSGWYLIDAGVWYRSDSWKGPFMATEADSVPSAVRSVPTTYRRHWVVPTAG